MSRVKIPSDFDAGTYLELNPDVKSAGVDPETHYLEFGQAEGRVWRRIAGIASEQDRSFHMNPKTKRSTLAKHTAIWNWIKENNSQPGLRVLEVGSRCVQSDALWRNVIPECDYVGVDIIDGKNVDIVGDAHRLTDYVKLDSVDLVISFAVFEHLAMPWVVVEEISKVLKVGGHAVIETHFSFSEHEQPWHYFQFNSHALEILFCEELGFEIVDSGLDTPIIGRFSYDAPKHLRGQSVVDLYCHSSIIVKKVRPSPESSFSWRQIASRITSGSSYPIESDLLYRQKMEKK